MSNGRLRIKPLLMLSKVAFSAWILLWLKKENRPMYDCSHRISCLSREGDKAITSGG